MTDAEFEKFLTDISVCFLEKDFAAWRARIRLPFSLVTESGPITLETPEALLENFNLYLEAHAVTKLDMVSRQAISIEHCDSQTVIGTYQTDLLSHGVRLHAPYTSSALIHHMPDGWRMSAIMNALGHHPWTGKHPYLSGETK